MTKLTKTLMITAALMAAASASHAKIGKCISPDGNVFDCVLAEPTHVAKAKAILSGSHSEGVDAPQGAAPESEGGGGGGGIEVPDLDIAFN